MRLPLRRRHAARSRPFSSLLAIAAAAIPGSGAVTFTPVNSPGLDLSQLGRVGLAGDFTGISLFQFAEQTETPFTNNGTEALLARMPNGAFAPVAQTDASILAMCDLTFSNGTSAGIMLGGNFTSFGGAESPGIAMFNPNTSAITPVPGLSGQVNTLFCDQDKNLVYVGGNFVASNSTNALAWNPVTSTWQNLPFEGFNGPVTSITKTSNGHIIFGGSFTGLGNTSLPSTPDSQIINLSTANITSVSSSTTSGFSDPRNIICKTGGVDGAGNTWLLQDNTPGAWEATFGFGFQPSKLRLYNTRQDGRSTSEWRFTALPLNGIMNFTYIDDTGKNTSCTNKCPLSNSTSRPFMDFHFVNQVGMNQFRIDISAWNGAGGGLDGIELFENDIFAYAIDDFNEPSCANVTLRSKATSTGAWAVTPSHSSTSEYLSVVIPSPISATAASIVFAPDLKESGDYSVNIYTPGCLQDNSCSTRGQFNITGTMTSDGKNPFQTTLFQTNNYDKYDQIYFGKIDAGSGSFRPQVTMTPVAGQDLTSMTFVAQKIGFTLINSTGGLTGLFEYDPSNANAPNSSDFSSSAFDQLGASFTTGSAVNALASSGDVTYIGGNFTSSNATNLVSLNSNTKTTQSLDGGLNGQVLTMVLNGTKLFVGGDFTNNRDNTSSGMNHVAVYDTSSNTWNTLGAGVNGKVFSVVLLTMNVTSTTPEVVVGVSGDFSQLLAFGGNGSVPVTGFGVWVPSQNNWLQNLPLSVEAINGVLSSSLINIEGGQALYGGSLSSSTLSATGVVDLSSATSVSRFPVNITASKGSSTSVSKRDTQSNTTISGVVTGLFDTASSRNNTIFAGHFTATATNGDTINNLLILSTNTVSGLSGNATLSANSTFAALAVQNNVLFAGGNVTGTVNGGSVNGLITYNLASNSFNTQPPSLAGGNTTVSVIAVRPNTGDVYVGGDFLSAGSLGCPGVCLFSTTQSQWNQPGTNLDGTVNSMIWASASTLVAGGNLKVNNTVSTFLVTYDATRQVWDSYPGASQLPGPVTLVTAASSDGSQIWVSGTSTNGSVYLMKYDGSKWNTPTAALSSGSIVRDLQVFTVTNTHDSTALVDGSQVLMLTGSLLLPGFGAAAAATFNGTAFQPFALTTNSGNTVGSIARVFVENSNFFTSNTSHLPLVFVVLIGLGISLALTLIIVVAGLFLDRLRKKREGYIPAPTSMYDRGSGMARIPPDQLLQNLSKGRMGAPVV